MRDSVEPAPGAKYGYIHVPRGKTRHAKRNVPLTGRLRAMLESRWQDRKTRWVFSSQDGSGPVSRFTVRCQHQVLRKSQKLPADFVIHSLRHTALTRLGESGAGAFEIMKAAGHSSVTVSQKYVHPSPESMERAFERLEAMNTQARSGLPVISQERPALAEANVTVLTTSEGDEIDLSREVA